MEAAEQGGGTNGEAGEEDGGLLGKGLKSSLRGLMGAMEVHMNGFKM